MAWCKLSSLTAAVTRTLKGARFPLTRGRILALTADKNVEGSEVNYFLSKALQKRRYADLRAVMTDLEGWLERQG
jgi:hypothetical protein